MKKNWMLRAAGVMLTLTMITSCFVGSTFAKYVTKGEGTDSARVAKWGVAVTANGSTFAEKYDEEDDDFELSAYSVYSGAGDDVVAPGTAGNMVSMTLTGTPEVAVRVSYGSTFDISDNWTVDNKFYCPLIISITTTTDDENDDGKVTVVFDGLNYDSATEFEEAVNTAIEAYSRDYVANTNLSGAAVVSDSLAISWEWPFEGTEERNGQTDYNDTWLGNQAAAGNPATVTLTVTTIVTQID